MNKTFCFLVLTSCLEAFAQPAYRLWSGANDYTEWDSGGRLLVHNKQRLTAATNLFQQDESFAPSGEILRTLNVYRAVNGRVVEQTSVEWLADGSTVTNQPSLGGPLVFWTGGNQGAITAVRLNGNKYRILETCQFEAGWQTGTNVCELSSPEASVVWLFREQDNPDAAPFMGGSVEIAPGERKTVRVPTPLNALWNLSGWDKCISCDSGCWLAGWPPKVSCVSSLSITAGHLNILPAGTYTLERSTDLENWEPWAVVQGESTLALSHAKPQEFFRLTP